MRSLEMLTVEDYEKIRKAVLVEGLSERQAARKFHHSRKTIKKALTHSVPPGYKKRSSPAGAVVLTERLRFVIDTLLEKNKTIRRKQKMTGTNMTALLEFCFTILFLSAFVGRLVTPLIIFVYSYDRSP